MSLTSIIYATLRAAGTIAKLPTQRLLDWYLTSSSALDLRGTCISEWVEDGRDHKETIRITRQRGNRIFGTVESDTLPGNDCRIEGHFTAEGRFLLMTWCPAVKKDGVHDYGCYFFEKFSIGLQFKGYSCGFYAHRGEDGKGETTYFEHTLHRPSGRHTASPPTRHIAHGH